MHAACLRVISSPAGDAIAAARRNFCAPISTHPAERKEKAAGPVRLVRKLRSV
jgi:hypothetical protein